jgi:hypothetical protein
MLVMTSLLAYYLAAYARLPHFGGHGGMSGGTE